jgi:predicted ester cyclase
MSIEQNIATLRRVIYEGFNKGNLDALDDCFAPSYNEHQFDLPSTLEGFKGSIQFLRNSFSDFSLMVEDVIADKDKVWVRMTGRGKNTKEFMGRPPTGKSFEITVVDVCRFENGKIVDHWGVPDRFHMLLQLGFLPQPAQK